MLFSDDASRYAATALAGESGPAPIQFLDGETAPVRRESLVAGAFATLVGYLLLWAPGAILNWHFLDVAEKIRRRTGLEPEGTGSLRAMKAVFFWLPLAALTGLLLLVLAGLLLLATA